MSVCCCSIECPSSRKTTRQEGESLPARGGLQSADSVPAAGTTRCHIQSAGALLLLQTFPRKGSRPPLLFLLNLLNCHLSLMWPPPPDIHCSPAPRQPYQDPQPLSSRTVACVHIVWVSVVVSSRSWERLDRPMFTETVDEDGLVHVDVSYGAGVQPPLFNVDVSGEPEPEYPPAKRAKH
ncbi:hypothetical protein F7725_011729 [Dissostichus mawsoni]|uniref:Uncharacterized protein n=1 Tax=Dissostichus mawsoni TaxID=36200 RepID=A0A7J5ZDV7_DISMA|nr:hypothetical protein F7725_011729 [Dissostichus mawsoni]